MNFKHLKYRLSMNFETVFSETLNNRTETKDGWPRLRLLSVVDGHLHCRVEVLEDCTSPVVENPAN